MSQTIIVELTEAEVTRVRESLLGRASEVNKQIPLSKDSGRLIEVKAQKAYIHNLMKLYNKFGEVA